MHRSFNTACVADISLVRPQILQGESHRSPAPENEASSLSSCSTCTGEGDDPRRHCALNLSLAHALFHGAPFTRVTLHADHMVRMVHTLSGAPCSPIIRCGSYDRDVVRMVHRIYGAHGARIIRGAPRTHDQVRMIMTHALYGAHAPSILLSCSHSYAPHVIRCARRTHYTVRTAHTLYGTHRALMIGCA
jgi:hypothetical protein